MSDTSDASTPRPHPRRAERSATTLHQLVEKLADERGSADFLTVPSGASISYAALATKTRALARLLVAGGVGTGDHVALCAENDPIAFSLLFACSYVGAAVCPLRPQLHSDELSAALDLFRPKLGFAAHSIDLKGIERSGIPTFPIESTTALEEARDLATSFLPKVESSHVLTIPTSGTTGRGKGVMLSDAHMLASASALAGEYRIESSDRFLCVLPTTHINALMITGLLPMFAGASVVLAPPLSVQTARNYFDVVEEQRVSVLSLTPSIMAVLLRIFPKPRRVPARFAFCGAAPLPAELWRRFEDHFSIPVFQGYGLTETTVWATMTPYDGPKNYDTVGVPRACEISIQNVPNVDPALGGEVVIRGPIVTSGYFRDRRATRLALEDGALRTGDLGYFDAAGQLRITGRLKEIIIRSGINIAASEIDATIVACSGVLESKTIGIPHELLGERVVSAFVPTVGTNRSQSSLLDELRGRLSKYKVPDAIVAVERLPKTATGKICIQTLRRMIDGTAANEAVERLDSWRYKRSHSPEIDRVREVVTSSFAVGRTLRFLTFWGVGDRDRAGAVDVLALDRLRQLILSAIVSNGLHVELTVVLTDLHANINQKNESSTASYLEEIRHHARQRELVVIRQSELWNSWGISLESARELTGTADFARAWASCPDRDQLEQQADKHCRAADSQARKQSAQIYYGASLLENPRLEAEFEHSIFVTYNGPEFARILPSLPKIYVYPTQKRVSDKPWFSADADE